MSCRFFLLCAALLWVGSVASRAQEVSNVASELRAELHDDIYSPEMHPKAAPLVKMHMSKIAGALEKQGLLAKSVRDGEVVRVSVPCSELFAPNDTVLRDKGRRKLDVLASILRNPTMYKVVVAVFSDDTGEEQYGAYITELRASVLEAYLDNLVPNSKNNVVSMGLGHDDSVAPNNSVANRALNRRVEIYIVPEWNMIKDAKSGRLN